MLIQEAVSIDTNTSVMLEPSQAYEAQTELSNKIVLNSLGSSDQIYGFLTRNTKNFAGLVRDWTQKGAASVLGETLTAHILPNLN